MYAYRLALATRSISSFFLMAWLLEEPLAALMNSSARHSAMVLMLRKAASRAPVVRSQMAMLTRRSGDTSIAWRRTTPAEPMRHESSRAPEFTTASTMTWIGFSPVRRWMISQVCFMMRTARIFLPLLRPCIISELVMRSTIGHWAFLKRRLAQRPAEWGRNTAELDLAAM